jgi:Divergent InlB B-repeat domain
VLDVNHDDYYGHSGTWDDIQDSFWLEHLDTPKVALTVSFSGAGEVASDVPGVVCTSASACATQWDQGAVLALTAKPAKTDRFVRWTGSCTGNGDCALKLDQAAAVSAVFGPLRIPVRATTAGRGAIACSPKCTKSFPAGKTLTLRAVAAKGWRFTGWAGGCKGTRVTCAPATDFALSVRATFRRR